MKRIAYAWARKLAERIGAGYVVIIAAGPEKDGEREGRYAWWGRSRADARAAFEVAQMIGGMAAAKPEIEDEASERSGQTRRER